MTGVTLKDTDVCVVVSEDNRVKVHLPNLPGDSITPVNVLIAAAFARAMRYEPALIERLVDRLIEEMPQNVYSGDAGSS